MDHLNQLQKKILELNSENINLQERVAVLKDCLSLEKVQQKVYELEKKEKILVLLENKVERLKLDVKPLHYLKSILYQLQNKSLKDDLRGKKSIESVIGSLNEHSLSDLLSDVDSESSIRVLSQYDIVSDEEVIKNYNDENSSKNLYHNALVQAAVKYNEFSLKSTPNSEELIQMNDRLEKTNTWLQANYDDSKLSDSDCSILELPLVSLNQSSNKCNQEINKKTEKSLLYDTTEKSDHSLPANSSRLSMDDTSLNTEDILCKQSFLEAPTKSINDFCLKETQLNSIDKNVSDLENTNNSDEDQNGSNSSIYHSWLKINDVLMSSENGSAVTKPNVTETEELNEGSINNIQYSTQSQKEHNTIIEKKIKTHYERSKKSSNDTKNLVKETSNFEHMSKPSNSAHKSLEYSDNLQINKSNKTQELNSFQEMNLKKDLLDGIYSNGFKNPLLLQLNCLNQCISGCDAILHSYPCTGKTVACLISVLQIVDTTIKECQGLILVPTKKLAISTQKMVKSLGRFLKVFTCIGSKNVPRKVAPVPHVIISTPQDLCLMIDNGSLSNDFIKIIVVDDVDDMIDDVSLCKQMKRILLFLHSDRQLILSSTVILKSVLDVFFDNMKDPVHFVLSDLKPSLGDITQYYLCVPEE